MNSRSFWMRVDELERPGATSTIYSRVSPPDEPGIWARVEVVEDPSAKRVRVEPKEAAA